MTPVFFCLCSAPYCDQVRWSHCLSSLKSHRFRSSVSVSVASSVAECVIDCLKFVSSHALGVCVMALSSYDEKVRAAAYHVLSSFYHHLEGARFREKRQVSCQWKCWCVSMCVVWVCQSYVCGISHPETLTCLILPHSFCIWWTPWKMELHSRIKDFRLSWLLTSVKLLSRCSNQVRNPLI